METQRFTPGNLVHARNRDWVVLPQSDDSRLKLRPLNGNDSAIAWLSPGVEEVRPASFPLPTLDETGPLRSGSLFRMAANLQLLDGAGPFRCFGHIAIEPRAYQIVPLLMAMKLDPVRLLIADDVGIGKTIEGGLIARELWDRGEITRISVLCPPHLVEQWVGELREHFNLPAEAVTATSIYRLEKTLPNGWSIHDKYPITVVSLDYIKTQSHRDRFISTAPEFLLVDEAHTCVSGGKERQLRYNLLKALMDDSTPAGRNRHLVMLTATPHSGDPVAFGNLLGLLDKRFTVFGDENAMVPQELRTELGLRFVQRRRVDIMDSKSYQEHAFPRRMTKEVCYHLTPRWEAFLDNVRDYCKTNAQRYEADGKGEKIIWYAVLSLFRCVASSPRAAVSALQAHGETEGEDDVSEEERIGGDTYDSDLASQDETPSVHFSDSTLLARLQKQAKQMQNVEDPKFDCLIKELQGSILKDGYRPIIFCKYISTAEYVGEELKKKLTKNFTVDVITGRLTSAERQERVDALSRQAYPILVATDCLSEGINLQQTFNAVVHYDLAWNPTRHEQREGRVDRFGQESPEVRCIMIWGDDNPVDGFILNVILRKADRIKSSLGVLVPIPENNNAICKALVKAAFFKGKAVDSNGQLPLGLEDTEVKETFEKPWKDALEKMKKNRTIFAQNGLHPEEVIPKWDLEQKLLGDGDMVRKFVSSCLSQLGQPTSSDSPVVTFSPSGFAPEIQKKFKGLPFNDRTKFSFHLPAEKGSVYLHRSSPLVGLLSSLVMESALDLQAKEQLGARCAVAETTVVNKKETMFLLRLRHQIITTSGEKERRLMAEEVVTLVADGNDMTNLHEDAEETARLFAAEASSNLGEVFIKKMVEKAVHAYSQHMDLVQTVCNQHAQALLEEHRGVRSASGGRGTVVVDPCFPPDLLGVYVLIPSIKEL
jgi:superfamily II DNA or RNA helicase